MDGWCMRWNKQFFSSSSTVLFSFTKHFLIKLKIRTIRWIFACFVAFSFIKAWLWCKIRRWKINERCQAGQTYFERCNPPESLPHRGCNTNVRKAGPFWVAGTLDTWWSPPLTAEDRAGRISRESTAKSRACLEHSDSERSDIFQRTSIFIYGLCTLVMQGKHYARDLTSGKFFNVKFHALDPKDISCIILITNSLQAC